jgi:very-short-patch-repair endonuclease
MRFADLPPGAQATVGAVMGEVAANAKRKLVTQAREDLADVLGAQLRAVGLGHFQREQKFHPTRKWRIDIAFTADMLAIECDGFAAGGKAGRHQRAGGIRQDNEKYAELAIAGWRLIRVERTQIRSGLALKWIERALA